MPNVQAPEPMFVDVDGVDVYVKKGQILDAKSPVVKGREHMFDEIVDPDPPRRTAAKKA